MHFFWLLFLLVWVGPAYAQPLEPGQAEAETLFQRLLTALRQIQIIDNHAHPTLIEASEGKASLPLPVRLRPTNPEYVQAFRVLYDYPHADLSPDHVQELRALKQQKRATLGNAYFNDVLDRVGIAVSLANRASMNRAPLDHSRFKWVPFMDAYLFPLDNSVYKKMNAEYQTFFSLQERLLTRYLEQVETRRPRTFDAYLQFIRESLGRLKNEGAVAVAFDVAHVRSLRFDDPSRRQARRVYERYRSSTKVPEDEYHLLQDYLFRYLLRQATLLKLPIQIHCGLGTGTTLSLAAANPLHLENLLNDPQYRPTTFVLLNGGYPFTREAILLAGKSNVYVDSSGHMTLALYPSDLARTLKEWLTLYPEKILFGTGAVVVSDLLGAEETYWLATETGRRALALALSEMVQEGRCDEAQALDFARLVLRENAAHVYRLP
ncbi:MAG: amidohydrolase family protein [Candidatus Binatia bacterium]